MEVNASQHGSDGLREGSVAVAGWRENLLVVHYANTAAKDQFVPVDCSEPADQCGSSGHPLWV